MVPNMAILAFVIFAVSAFLEFVHAGNSCVTQRVCLHSKRSPYGSVVDQADKAPNALQAPGYLPKRADGSFVASGSYSDPCTGCLGGDYLMVSLFRSYIFFFFCSR